MSKVKIREDVRKRFIIYDKPSEGKFAASLSDSMSVEEWDDKIVIFGTFMTDRVAIPKRFVPALIKVLQEVVRK